MLEKLRINYNLSNVTFKKLDGYISTNFKIESSGNKYVLKVYPANKCMLDFIESKNQALKIFTGNPGFPQVVKNNNKENVTIADNQVFRLLTYLEGDFLAEINHTKELFKSFGEFLANMDLQFKGFKNNTIKARQFEWDLKHFQSIVSEKITSIPDPSDRKLVEYFFMQHREHVVPQINSFRKQIIHNDANDWNVLVQNNKVSGIIDFGDICHTQLINELAIGITYAIFGKENPIEWAKSIITGYHSLFPLEERETDVLYWLIAARICTSLCNSAQEKRLQPHNEYITISEKPAWELLKKWVTINPVYARNEFRKAAGFDIPPERNTDDVRLERYKSLSSVFSISYKKPIYMESAAFQYMFDKYGNSYLDAYNNIPHVGHSHPKVVEAAQKQIAQLNTNTRYLYDQINEYASNLLNYFPDPLNKVFLVNSGSAASDLAIRLTRTCTGKKRVAALEHGYHGNTSSSIEISHYKFARKGGKGASKKVLPLPITDTFRGEFKEENAGFSYAQQAIRQINDSEDKIAAFIAEPIVGCGGQVPLAKGYLKEVYAAVRNQGGICISDEVQTGFGRLGDVFWGYEMYDVVPDIVILGKPMGNGHPLGAVVTTTEIAEAFNNGMEFFSSFGGNPVSCVIGQSVLDVLEEEQLQQNAKTVGDYYIQKLNELQIHHESIGDVRGSGLFIGFEFVKDRLSLEPDTELAQKVKNELRNRNILVSTDGPFDNVIKSKPPLCFTKENVDEVIDALDSILSQSL